MVMQAAEALLKNTQVEVIRGVGVGVPAGSKLYQVMAGDTVRVKATVGYQGPALNDHFYAAIGNQVLFFDEIWTSGLVPIGFNQSATWQTYELSADIEITKIANLPWTPGWFDLYVKINGQPSAGKPLLQNIIEVMLASEFQNFAVGSYEILAPAG